MSMRKSLVLVLNFSDRVVFWKFGTLKVNIWVMWEEDYLNPIITTTPIKLALLVKLGPLDSIKHVIYIFSNMAGEYTGDGEHNYLFFFHFCLSFIFLTIFINFLGKWFLEVGCEINCLVHYSKHLSLFPILGS